MKTIVQRYPLASYFVLAYGFAWILIPLTSVSLVFGFLALFGPAISAILITYLTEGSAGLKALWGRALLWKVSPYSYALAILLPPVLALLGMGLAYLLGTRVTLFSNGMVGIVTAVLFVGEELGWRGYALPGLLATKTPLKASLILGLLWALWHLPNFIFPIPGLPPLGPFPVIAIWIVAGTFLFTWLYLISNGSILIAILFHASMNAFTFQGIASTEKWVILAAIWGAAALLSMLWLRGTRAQQSSRMALQSE